MHRPNGQTSFWNVVVKTHKTCLTVCLCTRESWMSLVPLYLKCLVSQGLYFKDTVPS